MTRKSSCMDHETRSSIANVEGLPGTRRSSQRCSMGDLSAGGGREAQSYVVIRAPPSQGSLMCLQDMKRRMRNSWKRGIAKNVKRVCVRARTRWKSPAAWALRRLYLFCFRHFQGQNLQVLRDLSRSPLGSPRAARASTNPNPCGGRMCSASDRPTRPRLAPDQIPALELPFSSIKELGDTRVSRIPVSVAWGARHVSETAFRACC